MLNAMTPAGKTRVPSGGCLNIAVAMLRQRSGREKPLLPAVRKQELTAKNPARQSLARDGLLISGPMRRPTLNQHACRRSIESMAVTTFTPLASTLGGILIGIAAVLLMLFQGRIAGISGIVGRLLPPYAGDADVAGALAFVVGLVAAPLLYVAATGTPVAQTVSDHLPLMAIAGVLVGFGTAYGKGCTSGHGVCGLARLSPRSIVATAIFMAAAFATVFVTRHVLGG
jgi:uncharacterized membrane protein YedE/YeeE